MTDAGGLNNSWQKGFRHMETDGNKKGEFWGTLEPNLVLKSIEAEQALENVLWKQSGR